MYSLHTFFSRLDQNSLVLLRTLTFAKQFLLTARLWQLADNYDTRTVGKYENLRGLVSSNQMLFEVEGFASRFDFYQNMGKGQIDPPCASPVPTVLT